MAGAGLEFAMGIGQQRRRARDEQPHMRRDLAGQPGMVYEAGIERRHAHHRGRLRQQRQHLVGIELRQKDHRAAGQQHDVGCDEQAVGMKDRQGMQQHVIGREVPVVDQHLGIRGEVAVAQHRALRPPGRAGSVEDRGEVFGAPRHIGELRRQPGRLGRQAAVALLPQRAADAGAQPRHQRRHRLAVLRPADNQPRFGIADEVLDLGQRIGGVERQEHRAGPQTGEVEDQGFRRFVDLHRHPVAGHDAELDQQTRETCRQSQHLAIGDDRAVARQQESFGGVGDAGGNQGEQVVGHGGLGCRFWHGRENKSGV